MAPERRTRLAPDERYAQLVALGVASLVDRPLHSLSIESLSTEAGVSRGLLFHYFGSKQGLHREVVRVARDSMLHASEPTPGLEPVERLHDTLTRIVRFVREHRGTFYSLVRGVASGDLEVREVVEQARVQQADRVIAVFLELGHTDTPLLRTALRSWVAFAEEMLVESAQVEAAPGRPARDELPASELVDFLERSAIAVAESVESAPHPLVLEYAGGMPQLEVRDVRPADHDHWVELYAGYRAFYALTPDPEAVETAWQWVSTGQHQFTGLVAVDQGTGEVIALANLRDVARPSAGRMGLYLDDLFTSPAARGQGAGTALLARIAEIARDRDAVVVRWITSTNNTTARRLYDQHAELRDFASYDMAPAEPDASAD